MRIDCGTEVSAPPEIVFATLMDVERWQTFIAGIETIELLTPPPVGVGTRFRETRTMFGRKAVEEMTFAVIEPPKLVTLTAHSHGTRYTAEHRIMPAPTGALLVLGFEGVPETLSARILGSIGRFMANSVRRHLEADLADVKREAERRAAA